MVGRPGGAAFLVAFPAAGAPPLATGGAAQGDRSTLAAFRRSDPARFLSAFRRRGDGRALDRDGLPADGNRRVAAFLSAFPAAWRRPLPTGAPPQGAARALRGSGAAVRGGRRVSDTVRVPAAWRQARARP